MSWKLIPESLKTLVKNIEYKKQHDSICTMHVFKEDDAISDVLEVAEHKMN